MHRCRSLFLIKRLFARRPATLLKKDFNTVVFLWILQNFLKATFSYRTPLVTASANTLRCLRQLIIYRSSPPEAFLENGVLNICSKFTEEHSCRSAISEKLETNFIEITLPYRCCLVNLLHVFKTSLRTSVQGCLCI